MLIERIGAYGGLSPEAANTASFHYTAGCLGIQLQAAPEGVVRAEGIFAACLVVNDRILGAWQKLVGISVAASDKRPPRTPIIDIHSSPFTG